MIYDGVDLARVDVEERVERGFCLVPERRELFGDMAVADNLLLGAYARRRNGSECEAKFAASVTAAFPALPSGRDKRRKHYPAASGRCWRSAAP